MSQYVTEILTTRGDLVRGGASGVAERVALGASGTTLQSDGTDAVWSAALSGVTLSLNDSDSTFNLTITSTSTLTTGRTLTLDVNDGARTVSLTGNLTIAADLITSGANSLTLTTTGATNVTLPTTGTLATLAGTETLTGKTLTSPVIGTRDVKEATGTLSQSNITGMNATPVELIAAPGAGKVIVVKAIELFHDYAVAAYINGGDVFVEYGGGVDIVGIDVALVTEGSDSNRYIVPSVYQLDATTATSAGFSVAAHANAAVNITNATAAFANGDATNIIKYKIQYEVITLLT